MVEYFSRVCETIGWVPVLTTAITNISAVRFLGTSLNSNEIKGTD